jgi:hypothetical protein
MKPSVRRLLESGSDEPNNVTAELRDKGDTLRARPMLLPVSVQAFHSEALSSKACHPESAAADEGPPAMPKPLNAAIRALSRGTPEA